MHKAELAFVIRRFFPKKNKLIIFTQNFGKIEVIANPINKANLLWPGMLISFNINKAFYNINIIENIDILFTPTQLEKLDNNIFNFYQLLELFYYFMPLNNPFAQGFVFLYNYIKIYNLKSCNLSENKFIQKIYLLKFFELIGFYPDLKLIKFLDIYKNLEEFFIDFDKEQKVDSFNIYLSSLKSKIDIHEEKKLDNWIMICLKECPYFKLFKTFNL